MHARTAPASQMALSAAAGVAAVTYGAGWLGLDWVYDVRVSGAEFQLDAAFPLGMLAAVLMATAGAQARGQARHKHGPLALSAGALAVLASSLWVLLVWAPLGAHPGQLELLRDAGRLGFALLAVGLPLALPRSVRALPRGAATAVAVVLAPMLLFPDHVEAAGLTDVRTTLPMLLFFAQAALCMSGMGPARPGWARRRAAPAEDGVTWLRAALPGAKASKTSRKGKKPRLVQEPMHHAPPSGPAGPERPRPPLPEARARKPNPWFFQF